MSVPLGGVVVAEDGETLSDGPNETVRFGVVTVDMVIYCTT